MLMFVELGDRYVYIILFGDKVLINFICECRVFNLRFMDGDDEVFFDFLFNAKVY